MILELLNEEYVRKTNKLSDVKGEDHPTGAPPDQVGGKYERLVGFVGI